MREKVNTSGVKHGSGEYNKKVEWISNMVKQLQGLEEELKVEIHIDILRMTLKISNWKIPDHNGMHGF